MLEGSWSRQACAAYAAEPASAWALDAHSAPISHSSVGWGKEVGKAGPERELGLCWHLLNYTS